MTAAVSERYTQGIAPAGTNTPASASRANSPRADMKNYPSKDDSQRTEQVLLLGIDLGTSRSSIVSQAGVRKTVDSYVGFPKDAVSRKMLGDQPLFGQHALNNRLALNLYRPLEKGVVKGTGEGEGGEYDKNLEACSLLIRHLVELAEPGRDELVYAVVGVPSLASDKNKQAILDACKSSCDAVMIVSQPFSVAYGIEKMSDLLVMDIGAGTTDLCRMHGTVPTAEDEISYSIAGDAIDLRLMELIRAKFPGAQLTQNMCKNWKQQYGYVSDAKNKIVVDIPVNGKPTPHDITDLMKDACEILVDPILEGIHKLIATFDPEFQDKLRNNIIIGGGGSQMDGLNQRVEAGLESVGGGKVTVVEEPLYAGANGALQLAVDMPDEFWQQLR